MYPRAPLCLLACDEARSTAQVVAQRLGVDLTPSRDVWFASGEAKHVIDANVRGTDVYIFARPVVPGATRSLYDRFLMLLHAVDAARVADAERVTVVLPYLPGSRQDKRHGRTREGVSTGLFARLLSTAGVSMLITVEPHNDAIAGAFHPQGCLFEAIEITRTLSRFLEQEDLVGDVVVSPDLGRLGMARRFARELKKEIVAIRKERSYSKASHILESQLIGDVDGCDVLLLDDMVDTGGSVVAAVEALWAGGARNVTVAAAHPLLSNPAWERMNDLDRRAREKGTRFTLVGTSSVEHPDAPGFYRSLPLEPLLAKVVRSVNSRGSVAHVVEEED